MDAQAERNPSSPEASAGRSAEASADRTDRADRIDRWKRSLLDLTLRNRLLDARDSQRSLTVAVEDVAALARALETGAPLSLEPFAAPRTAYDATEVEKARAAEALAHAATAALAERRLLVPLGAAELDKRLVTIARAAAANLSDGGVHTLWLALGLLEWTEEDGGEKRQAPLALWPVKLSRRSAAERYRLTMADEDPRINETLFEKLRADFGIELPAGQAAPAGDAPAADPARAASPAAAEAAKAPATSPDDVELPSLMARLAQAIAGKPGWKVAAGARLGVFSFAKFVMWTDLAARAERLLESRVVAHLASGEGAAFAQDGDLPEADALDAEVPAGSLLTPLDADASQLAAVRAAALGRTFVLQGPPGTGKSQTIANLIAHCISEGKSVLFVSEKMAALEVVHRRLTAAGLGDFCLELHSHKARRKDVVEQLGRVLERSWRPVGGGAGDDHKLAALRALLDDTAAALHEPGPLGGSVHDLLGKLVELRDAPKLGKLAGDAAALADLDAAGWASRRDAVVGLAHAATALGEPEAHPWHGSQLAEWQLTSGEQVTAAIDEAEAASRGLVQAMAALDAAAPGLRAQSTKELAALAALCAVAARSPKPTAELVDAVASGREDGTAVAPAAAGGDDKAKARAQLLPVRRPIPRPTDPQKYVELARRHRALAEEVDARFLPAIEPVDVTALAATFRAWAGRFFLLRLFALRKPRAQVRALLAQGILADDETTASELDKVAGERALRASLEGSRQEAERWFGVRDPLRRDGEARDALDLERIDEALDWSRQLVEAFGKCAVAEGQTRAGVWRALLAQLATTGDGAELDLAPFSAVASAIARWNAAEAELEKATGMKAAGTGARHLDEVIAACQRWRPAVASLRDHVAYVRASRQAEAAGVGAVAAALQAGEVSPADAPAAWERATLLAHCEARIAARPALRDFHGSTHHTKISEFADLDRATLVQAKARAVSKLAERVPKASSDASGEISALLHEVKKKQRHRPLRQLFRSIPSLLPRLKPCLMMSPLSVAQYLDPSLPRFDLVVFDEASQIPTADAIGALARGEHAVIVGDSRQLPPTRFFENLGEAAGDRDSGEAGDALAEEEYEELESILDEAVAARLPELSLRWHYRSRHEDLIAFSNTRYYDDRLQVFPSAGRAAGEAGPADSGGLHALGVSLRRVDGVYDRAGSRTNRREAEAVVAEVLARLRDPVARKRSLGVVTFSRAQQDLVEDLLDEALRHEPELEPFFAPAEGEPEGERAKEPSGVEPVLIKNLESVQGDERDVMLFSVGYGPDKDGAMTLGFGPLNRAGGERRLNVAVTRAREQLVVFASFEPDRLAEASALGVRHLGELLDYARAGGGSALPPPGTGPTSPISAAIAASLEARGYRVVHQLGCAGYRLDLAVVDPNDANRYVLAIETDGPAYGSAKVARDRDRLRAQVLGQLGWRLHRIWSLDFWNDPEKETSRAQSAVISAIAAGKSKRGGGATGVVSALSAASVSRATTVPTAVPRLRPPTPGQARPEPGATDGATDGATNDVSTGAPDGATDGASPDAPASADAQRAPLGSTESRPVPRDLALHAAATVPIIRAVAPPAAAGSVDDRAGSGRTRGDSSGVVTRSRSDSSRPTSHSGPTGPHSGAQGSGSSRTFQGPTLKAESLGIVPYAVANVPAGRRAPNDLYLPKHGNELGKVIEQVLAAEAPMRIELLVRRVAAYFGIAKVSAKDVEQVRGGLGKRAQWGAAAGDEADVVWRLDQDPKLPPPVRAQAGTPQSRRDIADVPLVELATAARLVVERLAAVTAPAGADVASQGIDRSDLGRELARLLGYGRATDQVLDRIDAGIVWASERGQLVLDELRVRLP